MSDKKLYALDPILHPKKDMLYDKEPFFVDKLYKLVTEKIQPPYAISIDGLWGTGKTSIMKLLEQKISDPENKNLYYPTFWFNPWEYQKTESVVLAFLQSLSRKFSKDEKVQVDLGKVLKTVMYFGVDIGLKAITKGTFGFEDIKLKDIEGKLKELDGENRETISEQFEDTIAAVKNEFRALIKSISQSYDNRPVIIFFDDLDRCLPDDAIELLEAVKNLFVVKDCNVIFICGIDTRVAKKFISSHYKGIEENFAINYFRKIFNLTISVPYTPNVHELLWKHIKKVFEWDEEKAKSLADMISIRGVQSKIASVRKYLNVANSFYAFLQINPEYEEKFNLTNDFVINLLIIKEVWQSFYEFLIDESLKERPHLYDIASTIKHSDTLKYDEQIDFLETFMVGKIKDSDDTREPFGKEYLHNWIVDFPSLK